MFDLTGMTALVTGAGYGLGRGLVHGLVAHGATVIVVNTTAAGQRKGPSILHLRGGAGLTLGRLVTAAFAGRKPRRVNEGERSDD